jgi:predicted RNA-binding protein with PUA-like domain
MAYWLLKTEPSDYSFADLLREKRVVWSGVSNAVALKNMRAMAKGDELLMYHTGDEKAVVGTATVAKPAYPDPAEEDPKLVAIDIVPGKALAKPVTLAAIKADARFAEWALVKIGRLSVVPTTKAQYDAILSMAR